MDALPKSFLTLFNSLDTIFSASSQEIDIKGSVPLKLLFEPGPLSIQLFLIIGESIRV